MSRKRSTGQKFCSGNIENKDTANKKGKYGKDKYTAKRENTSLTHITKKGKREKYKRKKMEKSTRKIKRGEKRRIRRDKTHSTWPCS